MKSLIQILMASTIQINSFSLPAGGVYVDYVNHFIPGKQVTGYERKINNVLGREKINLGDALSLGHYGEVVVSYTGGVKKKDSSNCFKRNREGPSVFVHEPSTSSNRQETVQVFVTSDRYLSKKTEWVSLGVKSVVGYEKNWIPFYMPEGMEIAYHVKLKDAGSMLTIDNLGLAGFEASAVFLAKPCKGMV